MKKDGMDMKQIAEKLNVKKEDIRVEIIKLVKSIKEKKTINTTKGRVFNTLPFVYELSIFKYKFPSFPKLTQVNDIC